jgi:hypothetical protein
MYNNIFSWKFWAETHLKDNQPGQTYSCFTTSGIDKPPPSPPPQPKLWKINLKMALFSRASAAIKSCDIFIISFPLQQQLQAGERHSHRGQPPTHVLSILVYFMFLEVVYVRGCYIFTYFTSQIKAYIVPNSIHCKWKSSSAYDISEEGSLQKNAKLQFYVANV